jgi:protein phosphatase
MVDRDPALWGMGTTMTLTFVSDGVVYWAHVGDSRLYLFSGGDIDQITEDDTIPGLLLGDGEITKEEARVHPNRNFLFEFIGCGEFEVHTGSFDVQKGDLLLLSTDGLHDEVPEETIVSVLRSNGNLEEKLEALVSAALDAGSTDNITVVGAE